MLVVPNVIFNENDMLNWDSVAVESFAVKKPLDSSSSSKKQSEFTPRKFRSLAEIYQSSNFAPTAFKPTTFEDAMPKPEWKAVMRDETNAIERNKTWKLVDLPIGTEAIGLKWIYKSKFNSNGIL